MADAPAPARKRKAAAATADDGLDDLLGMIPSLTGMFALRSEMRWLSWLGIGAVVMGLLSREVRKTSWARVLAGLVINLTALAWSIDSEEKKLAGAVAPAAAA